MDTKKLVTHALAAALGIAVGSKGSSGAAAARCSTSPSSDPVRIATTTPLHDPDDARALAELEKLHELRWLARAATLAEKERVLLERVVATIDRDERQAVALLACAGGGDGPLERDVAVKLQAATRGAHGAELRCALLDFLVSRADRDSIEPTLVELVRTETDPAVRTRAVRDLASVASPDDPAVATLVRATEDRDSAVRAAAVVGLAPLSSDETALGAVLDATARETDSAAKRQMAAALRIAHPELTFPTTDERGPP